MTERKKSLWIRFLDWWSPERLEETAQCKECESVVSKSQMVFVDGVGWFCNEKEAERYWLDTLR